MIKKFNIALVVAFAAMLAMKGLKEVKKARERRAQGEPAPVAEEQKASELAPNVYYSYWAGYTMQNPISNRNGVLLDIIRAIFPKCTFHRLIGNVEDFAKKLREDPHAVLVGFGTHPALDEFKVAPTPLMTCPLVMMTLRTNPWRYKDFSSLTNLRIVADEAYLDYKVIRDLRDRTETGSAALRLLPSSVSKMDLADIVERDEADGFVMADMRNVEGVTLDGLMSSHLLHGFRKSAVIGNDGTMFFASKLDPEFCERVVKEYEDGMRRLSESGRRRRIFEYYGMNDR